MTNARDIDVARVLEDVPGVHAVLTVRGAPAIEYAVHVEDAHSLAAAHYALLRVLTHPECAKVEFYRHELPASVRKNATCIELSASQRADARARIPLSSPALEQTLAVQPEPFDVDMDGLDLFRRMQNVMSVTSPWKVLIVDEDPAVERAAAEAFGSSIFRLVVAGPRAALREAKAQRFDVIMCDIDCAFGAAGFVSHLADEDPLRAQNVILIMQRHGVREPPAPQLGALRLRKPVTAGELESVALLTVAGAGRSAPAGVARSRKRRILVIDESSERIRTNRLTSTVTHDVWDALELLHEDWDLVVCSLSMKTETGARLYSVLWKARPEIKSRFALLVDHHDDSNRVLTRPLTAAAVGEMLDRIEPRAIAERR